MDLDLRIERFGAREWPSDRLEALFAGGFPAFIVADREAEALFDPVQAAFPSLHLVLVEDGDVPVAAGWAVPIAWDGEVAGLPAGYTDSLRRAMALREGGRTPDTLVICAGVVHPERKGTGLAGRLVAALTDLAGREGWARVIAPLRPTLKHRYPLTPIEAYVGWVRGDGLPFDPWIRLHVRMGARILRAAPRSQTMTGTVAEWEAWTGMAFPMTGDYVIPDGLSVLRVDRDEDLGVYVEPNVWVQHRG